MSATIPTVTPTELFAGDTLEFKITLTDYLASDGWTLYYVLINSALKITFNSTASGDDHLIDVAPATTANYTAGKYNWQSYVSDGTDRYTIDTGYIEIKENFTAQTTYDARSDVQKIFEALEAAILGRADNTQLSRKVGDREIRYMSVSDLLQWRNFYKREYDKLQGKTGRKIVKMRFNNV